MTGYFESFDRISKLKREGHFDEAFAVAVAACEKIPKDRYGFNPGPPCDYLATYAIVHQNRAALDRLIQFGESRGFQSWPDEYGPNWASFFIWARETYDLFEKAVHVLESCKSIRQDELNREVGAKGRELSDLLRWAERFQVVKREKCGRTYLVSIKHKSGPNG